MTYCSVSMQGRVWSDQWRCPAPVSSFSQPSPILRSPAGVNFGEAGRGLVPVALQFQMVFQPADELHGALGEPLDGLFDDGCAWGADFDLTAEAGMAGFRPALVLGQAEQAGLLGFCGGTAGPGFGFAELVLELVKNTFSVSQRALWGMATRLGGIVAGRLVR